MKIARGDEDSQLYSCGTAALWLPRVLGGAVLTAGLLVAFGLDSGMNVQFMRQFRAAIAVIAGLAALWVLRRGGEVRIGFGLREDGLVFVVGSRRIDLRYRDIEGVRYEPPFAVSRSAWIPAVAVIDRSGVSWRIPALVTDGGDLVAQLVSRTGREDLAAWADALDLRERMSRSRRWVVAGYSLALLILAVATLFYVR